jgi:predicted ATPase
MRGEYQTARELAEQSLTRAQDYPDPAFLVGAHVQLGVVLYFLGEMTTAHGHLAQALALSNPQQGRSLVFPVYGQDDMMVCLGYTAWTLWILGYPEQALMQSHTMLTRAQASSHAFTLARALFLAGVLQRLRRERTATQEQAETALALATEQGFGHYVGLLTLQRGWALATQGQGEAGIAQMRQGLAAIRATGQGLGWSAYLAMLAEAYGNSGQAGEGLRLLAKALAHVDHTGERYYEAEVYRLKGELLWQQSAEHQEAAEESLHQALAVARRQQAKSWELRAAMSPARLWQQQGKRAEARELLAPIYGWFTEGFDTADLQDARTLLEELA